MTEVTSPYGPQRSNSWRCTDCDAHHDDSDLPIDRMRYTASMHVRAAGHQVVLRHGTEELLIPVFTAAGSDD